MQATQKYIRTSPRKLRLVADAVRGLKAQDALNYLRFLGKRAAHPLSKSLNQAIAAAKLEGHDPAKLTIKTLDISEGPTFKRFRAVSRGSAHKIMKRSSHIHIVLEAPHGTKS